MGLIIDSREPTKYRSFLTAQGMDHEVQQLVTGDYICFNDNEPEVQVCIERKRLDDLISTYYGKRMETQFERLSNEKFAVLIITGNMRDASKGVPFRVMAQMVEEVISLAIVRYNFRSVIWMVDGIEDVHQKSFIMMVKALQKIVDGQLDSIPQKKLVLHKDARVNALRNFFGIDATSSKNLLKKFGTVKKVMNLTDAEILSVKGIGPAKMKTIRFVLDESFNKGNFEQTKSKDKKCEKCGNSMTVVKMVSGNTFVCKPCTFGKSV